MTGEKSANPCNKFQANVFNKSKCQNCFKSREVHLFSDHSTEQVKPIYSGWLCLAPEGTDFDSRLQRSRKWQRRFFILDEQGSLSYALDELPSTLPQGTVNMNLCTDITDAEGRTGQKNSLCIVTPTQETFIRDDHREVMNGWSEQLAVFLRTNKQNQNKKRKVEPLASQEPSPAKMVATDPRVSSSSDDVADSGPWQGDLRAAGPHVTPSWTSTTTDPPGLRWTPAGSTPSYLCPASCGSQDPAAAAGSQLAESSIIQTPANKQNKSQDRSSDISAGRLLAVETTRKELRGGAAVSRQGRTRTSSRESCDEMVQLGAPPPQRRSKSLDRRTSDSVMTPDLLNFKKGWMVILDENDQWKKYWFVLSADSLRYYKDAVAEETSDLDGEIDLTKCYNVSDYDVPRNYGFQMHTPKGVFTLSAMTAGIRKNWIQALMKNVRPVSAPDVASLPGHKVCCRAPKVLPKPDVTQDSASPSVPTETDPRPSGVTEKHQQGGYKTSDWSEFRPRSKSAAGSRESKPLGSVELRDQEGRRRREERRRKYEDMLGFSLRGKKEDSHVGVPGPQSQQRVDEEVEEFWRRVETAAFRAERMVPLAAPEMEELLQSYRKQVEELKVQLAESERRRLEAQLSSERFCQQQLEPPLGSQADFCPGDVIKKPLQDLKDSYTKSSELLRQQLHLQSSSSSAPSIWLHDAHSRLKQLEDFPAEAAAALLASSASDVRHELCETDGKASHCWDQLSGNNGDFTVLKPTGRDDDALEHVDPYQMMLKRLSQEVELLGTQNEALNQRNQEMLNQLTEADREIERLKAELSRRYSEEHQGQKRLEDLQTELGSRNQELLEAQTLVSSLQGNLRETEALLQLSGLPETEAMINDENLTEGFLLRCFRPTEAKLTELERQLHQAELTCSKIQLMEAGQGHSAGRSETERLGEEGRNVSGEEKIQKVIEGMVLRLAAVERLVEAVQGLGLIDEGEEEEEGSAVTSQLRREERFWSLLLNKLKEDLSDMNPVEEALRETMERMKLEKRMLLLGHDLLKESMWDGAPQTTEPTENGELERLKAATQAKISLLKQLSSISSSMLLRLQPAADALHHFHLSDPQSVSLVYSAVAEVLYCRHAGPIHPTDRAELCQRCRRQQHIDWPTTSTITCCPTDGREGGNPETAAELMAENQHNGMEIPPLSLEKLSDGHSEICSVTIFGSSLSLSSELRVKVKELEEQVEELTAYTEQMKQEMSRVKEQHERELEKLKATCERGLSSMKECHLKEMEEQQRLHQQELERLLVERDMLLEEESAATATAIRAIRRAHQEELQREVQRRHQTEGCRGDSQLEDVCRQHREELDCFRRELDVLSQQFSLKCLENTHLVQALDAERKVLCQCQLENQDLSTRNQELSGDLAAEISRLCSLARQDALPLSQEMDVYEMEITLRVKESEVQSLKHKITSLKDELQLALKGKRDAVKEYKDVLAELSIFRAKAEQEADELRENLRLAHQALDQTSP